MRIAILGGTGAFGGGLALRWGRDTNHDLLVGSRDPERAREAVEEYQHLLAEFEADPSMLGFANGMAAERADVIVLAVSAAHVSELLAAVGSRLTEEAIVVTPVNRMERHEAKMLYTPPTQGSVTALVRENVPKENPVVGAFHTLAAKRLRDLERPLELDTLVFGDEVRAVEQIRRLAEEIEGLSGLRAGGLDQAATIESLTPLLINVGAENDREAPGLRIN